MEVACNRSVLYTALRRVTSAASEWSTLPVLRNVLLRADHDGLTLLTTDLEVWIGCLLPSDVPDREGHAVEVLRGGAITVPARLLTEVVGVLPEASVQLRALDQCRLLLTTGSQQYEIKGLSADVFPSPPDVAKEGCFRCNQRTFADLIDMSVFAAFAGDTHAVLAGALLTARGSFVSMVATDTYRLGMKEARLLEDASGRTTAIIPACALRELSRLLSRGQDSVLEARLGPHQILFRIPTVANGYASQICLITRLIEGQFPSIDRIIESAERQRRLITVNRKALLDAIRRCIIMASPEGNWLSLEAQPGLVRIHAESSRYGSAEDSIPASLEGESIRVSFDGRFAQDALRRIRSASVRLLIRGSLLPVILRPDDDHSQTYLVATAEEP